MNIWFHFEFSFVTVLMMNAFGPYPVIKTFRGTESDVIYPEVNKWLSIQLEDDVVASV